MNKKKDRKIIKKIVEKKEVNTIEDIMKIYELTDRDFWDNKEGVKIIRHRGCLKIARIAKIKLNANGYEIRNTENKNGYVEIVYRDKANGIFEIGEVNPQNCTFKYPYLVALKRVQDRVILKLSGLAEKGIYSEIEAEEFKIELGEAEIQDGLFDKVNKENKLPVYLEAIGKLQVGHEVLVQEYIKQTYKKTSIDMLDEHQARQVVLLLSGKE